MREDERPTSSAVTLPGLENVPLIFRLRPGDRKGEVEQILVDHKLYFTAPAALNDPHEAKPRIVFSSNAVLTSEEIKQLVAQTMSTANWSTRLAKRRRLEAQMRSGEAGSRAMRRHKTWFRDMLSESSLCCFFSSPSTVHWAHYGGNHKGFGLAFAKNAVWQYTMPLERSLTDRWNGDTLSLGAERVDYVADDQFPTVDLDYAVRNAETAAWNAFVLGLRTKSVQWKDEAEYRMIRPFMPAGYQKFKPRDLRAVILGSRATETMEAEVRECIRRRRIAVNLYRAVATEGQFGLQFSLCA